MWHPFVSGLLGGLGHTAARGRPRRAPSPSRRRPPWRTFLLVAAALALLALVIWGLLRGLRAARAWWPSQSSAPPTRRLQDALELAPHARPRAWTAIVLHHSGTPSGSAASFDAYHRQKGWRSLGYDFVIGNGTGTPDGCVETGPRWRNQESGAHAHSEEFNQHGVGICLVGNFNERPPSPAQLEAARALVRELCRRYRIPKERIFGHGDIREGGGTDCPGRQFQVEEFVKGL